MVNGGLVAVREVRGTLANCCTADRTAHYTVLLLLQGNGQLHLVSNAGLSLAQQVNNVLLCSFLRLSYLG